MYGEQLMCDMEEKSWTLDEVTELLMGCGTANGGGDWSRHAPPNATIIYKIGIYGWRKRCLYCLVLLLMITAIVNLALTIWILKVMDFSIDGMGKLRIQEDGIRVEGNSEFLRALYAKHIRSTGDSALYMESSRNITLNARDETDRIVNKMLIGDNKVESFSKKFEIKSPQGKSLFYATDDEVYMGADKLTIASTEGATFKRAVQTPLVTTDLQNLRIEAPTRSLYITAKNALSLKAPAGEINLQSLVDITLKSTSKGIHLSSNNISFQSLPTSSPRFTGRPYSVVYQLCLCDTNGKLFLSPAIGNCQANTDTCL